ncbi:hypothetical protein [Corynebacterium incognita]|uniref:hypothetical protein n=1 Tax=Corynebacterium incognita TaxID=2754725 RepID=UPI001FE548EC|nr:hypothetical protein [Corynebacterium incognita]
MEPVYPRSGIDTTEYQERATKQCGQYDGNSVLVAIAALDDFLFKTGLHEGFLDECLGLIAETPGYFEGIARPRASSS